MVETDALDGKIAAVTGAASGIGQASTEAMLNAGATVVLVDRDESALNHLCEALGERAIPLVVDLLDSQQCANLVPRLLDTVDHVDIFHANAGAYVGGDLLDAETDTIDRVIDLNVNVAMKNIRDMLPPMVERGTGDIVVTCSVAGHYPVPWEPVYASSKWAINCFVQTTRRQVIQHGIRMGEVSPGPVSSALLNDWPAENLRKAKESGSLIEPDEVADCIMFMLTRPRNVTIRDVIVVPTNFDM
ncbi:SDR family oxidoreductase [Salinisphaera sp. USBA-960]|nr:SDR family oxidoreductase [Salifodinibacter halophilus]NNC27015.1 SDR family oxidoreductase [Salifodinibacter halophilus]